MESNTLSAGLTAHIDNIDLPDSPMQSVGDFLLTKSDNSPISKFTVSNLPSIISNEIICDYEEQQDLVIIDDKTKQTKLLVGLGSNKEALTVKEYTDIITEEYKEAGRPTPGECMGRIQKRIDMFRNVPTPIATTASSISNGVQTIIDSMLAVSKEKSKSLDADVVNNELYYGSTQGVSSDIKKKIINLCKSLIEKGIELDLIEDYIVDTPEYRDILGKSGLRESQLEEAVSNAIKTIRGNNIRREKIEAEESSFIRNDMVAIKNSSVSLGKLFDLMLEQSMSSEEKKAEFEAFLRNTHDVRYIVGSDKFYCPKCDKLVPGKDWYTVLSPINVMYSIDEESTANVIANPQQCPHCQTFYTLPSYVLINIRDYIVTRNIAQVGAPYTGVTTSFSLTSKTLAILAGDLYVPNEMIFSTIMDKDYNTTGQLSSGKIEVDKSQYSTMIEEYVKFYKTTKLKKGEAKTVMGSISSEYNKELNSIGNEVNTSVSSITDLLLPTDISDLQDLGVNLTNVKSRRDLNSKLFTFIDTMENKSKKIPYDAPDMVERTADINNKINFAKSLLPINSTINSLSKVEIDTLLKTGIKLKDMVEVSDLVGSISRVTGELEVKKSNSESSPEVLEDIDKTISLLNSLTTRLDKSNDGRTNVVFRSLKDSKDSIKKNCKMIVSACGGNYQSLKVCAVNSLIRELRDGMLNDILTTNTSDISQEEFINSLKEYYNKSQDKLYFEERLLEFYHDKTTLSNKPEVDVMINELQKLVNRDYMYEFVLPYSFIKIDLGLTEKPVETTDSVWVDIVSDLMIVANLSTKFDSIVGIGSIPTVSSYIESAHSKLVEDGVASGKLNMTAIPSAKPDSLAKTMTMMFELNGQGSPSKTWNDIISKDNCIRFEDADVLYKAIKSRQYGGFLLSKSSNAVNKRIDSLVFIDKNKVHDATTLQFLTTHMETSIKNRKKLLVTEFNSIRKRIVESVFGKLGSEVIKKELSTMLGQLKVPYEYTPLEAGVKSDIVNSDLLILPHPKLHYLDMLGLINQIRDNGHTNVRIPLHLEGKVSVDDIVKIESIEELKEVEELLGKLYATYIQAIKSLQAYFKELKQNQVPNMGAKLQERAIRCMEICDKHIIESNLNKVYYLNVMDLFYTFPEDEDYFAVKSLSTMYTAMSLTSVNPKLVDRVVRYSSVGLDLPTSVISSEHQISIDNNCAGTEVTVNDYVRYILTVPFTGSTMIDYIKDNSDGSRNDLLVPISADGRVLPDPSTDEYPFSEDDMEVYKKATAITSDTSVDEVMRLLISSSDFEFIFSQRPERFKRLSLEDITSVYQAIDMGVDKVLLDKFKYYTEQLETSDISDRKTIALFVRYRAKVTKMVEEDNVNMEEVVATFDNIINGEA